MLKRIGGYMPRMWEGRCKPCSLRSAVCSVPPMSRGCRAHIAAPGTVGRNTGLDAPASGRTITDRPPVTDRCATDEAMNACAAARDEGLSKKDSPQLSQKSAHLDLPVLEKARRDRESHERTDTTTRSEGTVEKQPIRVRPPQPCHRSGSATQLRSHRDVQAQRSRGPDRDHRNHRRGLVTRRRVGFEQPARRFRGRAIDQARRCGGPRSALPAQCRIT